MTSRLISATAPRFKVNSFKNSLDDRSGSRKPNPPPAACNTTSIPPKNPWARCTPARSSSISNKSNERLRCFSGNGQVRRTASSLSWVRAINTSLAPCSASAGAATAPNPLEAPVTRTRLPCSFDIYRPIPLHGLCFSGTSLSDRALVNV